jgi:integrase
MLMRIRGIKPVTVTKPSGRVYKYYYHRATNKRIEAKFGTAAFAAEVAALDTLAQTRTPRDGTLKALIVAYKKSPEYGRLGYRSKADYGKVFDFLAPIDDMPVASLDTAGVYRLRDLALRKRKRRFANYVVQVIRLVLSWGKPRGFVEENVAIGVKLIPRPKGMARANPPWTDDEREVVLAEASIELRAMIALGMFAGLREGDACSVPKTGWSAGKIECIASKNNEAIWLPVHFRLEKILRELASERVRKLAARVKRRKVVPMDPPTLTVTSKGRSWTEAGFRASFFKLLRRLEATGQVRRGLTFHGLRHTMGKLVIEAGGSKEDVKMILGDRSDAMGEFYSREFEKRGRVGAAMQRLEQTERAKMENRADQNGKPENRLEVVRQVKQ